jgi:hypothetical protein
MVSDDHWQMISFAESATDSVVSARLNKAMTCDLEPRHILGCAMFTSILAGIW